VRTAGMPWRAVAAPGPPKSPPGLGEHTQDVLRELGLLQSAAQYDR
jgi:crotonobetainyl-CoA:carnitine CoA-transferase CaiB-like acyl-CoA transferase